MKKNPIVIWLFLHCLVHVLCFPGAIPCFGVALFRRLVTACVIKNSNLKKFTGELFKIAFYYLNLRLIKVNRSDACCLFLKRLYLQKYFLI